MVPDRWEFANGLFRRGEKHLLCEIHRRKTSQPPLPSQPDLNHLHHHRHPPPPFSSVPTSFFQPFTPFHISNISSDHHHPYSDAEPSNTLWPRLSPPATGTISANAYHRNVAVLTEDNERLRRSNDILMSEISHMKRLYNDIIYFVQNHIKPVSPSPLLSSQKPLNQFLGFSSTKIQILSSSSPTSNTSHQSSVTIVEENDKNVPEEMNGETKLFGVSLQTRKRSHDQSDDRHFLFDKITKKSRLVLEENDLGLNLTPFSR